MEDLPVRVTTEWLTPVVTGYLAHGARIVLIIVGSWIALAAGNLLSKRIADRASKRLESEPGIAERVRTVSGVLRNLYRYVVVFIASLLVLSEFGVDLGPLLAGAGILGLAIGFGSQELVKDVIAGYFILIEGEFGVGDVIKVGEHVGTVERLGLRNIKLVAFDGSIHVIPNSQVSTLVVLSKGFARAFLKVDVAYSTDFDKVRTLLSEYSLGLMKELDYILGEPEILGVNSLKDSGVEYFIAIKVKPGKQHELQRRMQQDVVELFRANAIEIPFPHQVEIVRTANSD
ncbi:MAG: mechanosensitive ion channel family protein [bacterium]|jgi:small conductance mechanosensitive channel